MENTLKNDVLTLSLKDDFEKYGIKDLSPEVEVWSADGDVTAKVRAAGYDKTWEVVDLLPNVDEFKADPAGYAFMLVNGWYINNFGPILSRDFADLMTDRYGFEIVPSEDPAYDDRPEVYGTIPHVGEVTASLDDDGLYINGRWVKPADMATFRTELFSDPIGKIKECLAFSE